VASSGSSHSPHLPHLPHVGLDRHIQEQLDDNEIITKQEQISDISKEKDANNTKIYLSNSRYEAIREIEASRKYLLQQPFKDGIKNNNDDDITFIEYLENHRIELNTILAAAGPEAFWNWLRHKLVQVWPDRDYRRAIFMDDYMLSPSMTKFVKWYKD
jgi:predicted ribonuclease YlaK